MRNTHAPPLTLSETSKLCGVSGIMEESLKSAVYYLATRGTAQYGYSMKYILPIIAQCIYDGEDLGHPYIQSTTVLCDWVVFSGRTEAPEVRCDLTDRHTDTVTTATLAAARGTEG